jgi:hypothetical protein
LSVKPVGLLSRLFQPFFERHFPSTLPTKRFGDFFPYSDAFSNDWSGFYGSRPALKLAVRKLEAIQSAADAAFTLAILHQRIRHPVLIGDDSNNSGGGVIKPLTQRYADLHLGRSTAALLLHHDAITGTCRRDVARDYLKKAKSATGAAQRVLRASFAAVLDNPSSTSYLHTLHHDHDHASLAVKNDDKRNGHGEEPWKTLERELGFVLQLFNPIAQARTAVVETPIERCDLDWVVQTTPPPSHQNNLGGDPLHPPNVSSYLLSQLSPQVDVLSPPIRTMTTPRDDSIAKGCVLFVEVSLAPLEMTTVYVTPVSKYWNNKAAYHARAVRSSERQVVLDPFETTSFTWKPLNISSKSLGGEEPAGNLLIVSIKLENTRVSQLRGSQQPGDSRVKVAMRSGDYDGIEVSQELREYLSSDGVGVGRGWGSSSGAYVFRTIIPALFGVGIVAAEVKFYMI